MKTFWLGLALVAVAGAQSPEFEVAAIRVNNDQPIMGIGPGMRNGLFHARATLRMLLASAYDVDSTRIVGPGWIENDFFEIEAKAPKGVSDSEMKPMLRALLKKRFGLEEHTESRELSVYDLVVAKGGPKITPYSEERYSRIEQGKRADEMRPEGIDIRGSAQMAMASTTMAQFSLMLSAGAGRPVLDKTGLAGKFSLFLYYAPPGRDVSADVPDLFTAMETELGLELRAAKEQMPVIVVDHLEKAPTEN